MNKRKREVYRIRIEVSSCRIKKTGREAKASEKRKKKEKKRARTLRSVYGAALMPHPHIVSSTTGAHR